MDDWYISRTIFKPRPRVKNYIYRERETDALYVRTLFLTDNIVCSFGEVVLCSKFGLNLKERQTAFSKVTVAAMNFTINQKHEKSPVHQKLTFKEANECIT